MWPSVPGDGRPLCNAIVTFAFPIAIPPSNSNSFFKPSARSNHFALRFGLRTASPKWPTTPIVNGILLISLKESRQASHCKSREQRHNDKGRRRGGIKTLSPDRADAHRNERPDENQDDRVLANSGTPFPQPQVHVGIAATLEERSPAQCRERGEDEREITEI